ncbi:hypothetical protein J3B02_005671, partial [Coemansia erecta]
SRSVTGGSEGELTKSEDEVRDRLQNVRIASFRGNSVMGSISEKSDSANHLDEVSEQPSLFGADRNAQAVANLSVVDEDPVIEIDEDIQALYRDIDEVSRMLPSSQEGSQHENEHSDNEDEAHRSDTSRKQQKLQSPEQSTARPTESMFVDVVIDQQPMDVGLEILSVDLENDETTNIKKKAGSPGKRKLSDSGKSVSDIPLSSTSSRIMPPRSAMPVAASRGRGRGRGKTRPGLRTSTSAGIGAMSGISRKPGLTKQLSTSSTASARKRDDSSMNIDISLRSDSRIGHHVAGGVNKTRVVAAAPAASGSGVTAAGPGRVAEFRRKFEPVDGNGSSAASSAFANPVVAMRPGYSGAANLTTSTTPNSIKRGPVTAQSGPRAQAARAALIKTVGAGQKSSTAAMREAARINAAAASASRRPAG